jgi:hypothetical protein
MGRIAAGRSKLKTDRLARPTFAADNPTSTPQYPFPWKSLIFVLKS